MPTIALYCVYCRKKGKSGEELHALGCSGVLSSEGCGRMVTSSKSPMLYTASMSVFAWRTLYTCIGAQADCPSMHMVFCLFQSNYFKAVLGYTKECSVSPGQGGLLIA